MQKYKLNFFSVILFFGIFGVTENSWALPSFPGAEGLGAGSVGGRGGVVIKVTNLNDSGAGSLRSALAATGPRNIVFEVSGNINLTSLLYITEPYVTIAGQTSPGGVSVSGKQFNVATHDVIIQHMRFRSGGHQYVGDDSDGDSFSIWGPEWNGEIPVYNLMIDHCSITWGTDETFSITGGVLGVTLQNSLIAQGLRYAKGDALGYVLEHSKGLMVSGKYNHDTEVSLYRNYIAHNTDRNPLMYNPAADNTNMIVDGANNVSYNWKGGLRPSVGGDAHVNWIANYMKEGPYSNRQDFIMQGESVVSASEELLYVAGNIGTARTPADPEWKVSVDYTTVPLSAAYQHNSRWSVATPLPFETMTNSLASNIVANSGATVPVRDSVDAAIVDSFDAGTSLLKDRVAYPADWPTYQQVLAPVDGDNDGMSDLYEAVNGLIDSFDDSAGDVDLDGYTNIEEYFFYLGGIEQANDTHPAAPSGLSVL